MSGRSIRDKALFHNRMVLRCDLRLAIIVPGNYFGRLFFAIGYVYLCIAPRATEQS